MFKKIFVIVPCLIALSGYRVMAASPPEDVFPLRNTTEVPAFMTLIAREGSDSPKIDKIIDKTINSLDVSFMDRILILRQILGSLTEGYPGIESKINSEIYKIVTKEYKGSYKELSFDMQYADILWKLETVDQRGEEVKDGYSGNTMSLIFSILKKQKNGCKEQAQQLLACVRKALSSKGIELSQFE